MSVKLQAIPIPIGLAMMTNWLQYGANKSPGFNREEAMKKPGIKTQI